MKSECIWSCLFAQKNGQALISRGIPNVLLNYSSIVIFLEAVNLSVLIV